MVLSLHSKPFTFKLSQSLNTSQGVVDKKRGWLIKLKNSSGNYGWGEIGLMDNYEIKQCEEILKVLGTSPTREAMENCISKGPGAVGFGIGSALAELDERQNSGNKKSFLEAPRSAILLARNESFFSDLDRLIQISKDKKQKLTLKLKVAIQSTNVEKKFINKLLQKLPLDCHLRLDANAGWRREEAEYWAKYFNNDSRLEWLEQPLASHDIEGLKKLSQVIPVALDESLMRYPALRNSWDGWQIRRPALEGDPRVLLDQLNNGKSHIAISSAFETGIGRRWIHHLASLQQQKTLTPTAPGLAPGWCPTSDLFSTNPKTVWEAA